MRYIPIFYVAMVHTWKDGSIDYVTLLDNRHIKVEHMSGSAAPLWLQKRAALLRLLDINDGKKGTPIGRRFNETMVYVYLTKKEHKQLSNLTNTGAEDEIKSQAG